MILAFGAPGHWEILLILFIILLLFGGRKLPELARALGKSLSEFKRGREESERLVDADKAKSKETDAEKDA